MTTILGEHSKLVLNPDEPVAEFSFATNICQGCGDECGTLFCDICINGQLLTIMEGEDDRD